MQLQEHIKAIHGSKKQKYASKHDSRLNTHFHNIVKSNVSQTKIGDYKYQKTNARSKYSNSIHTKIKIMIILINKCGHVYLILHFRALHFQKY